MGSLQFWSVGGTEESKWVEFFLLNPPEMTRQFSLATWGTVLVAISSGSLYLGSLVTKKESSVCLLQPPHTSDCFVWLRKCYLWTFCSTAERRQLLISFADSPLKAE